MVNEERSPNESDTASPSKDKKHKVEDLANAGEDTGAIDEAEKE